MKTKLSTFLEFLRTSYWLFPAIMSLGALVLSVAMMMIDQRYDGLTPEETWWLYGGNANGARAVLIAVAGSMISVTSVVFSITIVALTLASGQFGSRIVRNFMRDRGNQFTLGTFISTFVYALLVLRTIRGGEDQGFVPALSVSVGMLLALVSVGVLIFFIHHVARSIQADSVIRSISAELHTAIDRVFPEMVGKAPPEELGDPESLLPADRSKNRIRVYAKHDDYLQAIDQDVLLHLAKTHDFIIKLYYRPGDFLVRKSVLADIWAANDVDETLAADVRAAIVQGSSRTMNQDAEFGIMQLVEIAVRALSPGINDPFTAIACIDRLSGALCHLAGRTFPARARFDKEGNLRVLADTSSFSGFVNAAFNQIRQNTAGSAAVLIRMLEGIKVIGEQVRTEEQRRVLKTHAGLVLEAGLDALSAEPDRADLKRRYAAAMQALEVKEP